MNQKIEYVLVYNDETILTNLGLFIKIYWCSWNYSFPWVESSSNDQILSGMSRYIYFYSNISIYFDFLNLSDMWNVNEFLYLISFNR